jgi:tRNA 2-selenouridine synthase SelU
MKVHNYNTQKYPFKILLEDLLECKLEKIHENYNKFSFRNLNEE